MKDTETTLVLLKPDALEKNLIWEISKRFEDALMKIIWMKMMKLDDKIIEEHYSHLLDKPFFPDIKEYMTSWNVVAMAIAWNNVVQRVRNLMWPTNPKDAAKWTIRWDFAESIDRNIIHWSDSIENAEIELKRFFKEWEVSFIEE